MFLFIVNETINETLAVLKVAASPPRPDWSDYFGTSRSISATSAELIGFKRRKKKCFLLLAVYGSIGAKVG